MRKEPSPVTPVSTSAAVPVTPRSAARLTPRRRRLLVVGAFLLIGAIACGWYLLTVGHGPGGSAEAWLLPPLPPESAGDRQRATVRAFTDPGPCQDADQLLTLVDFFQQLDDRLNAEASAAAAAAGGGGEGGTAGATGLAASSAFAAERLLQEAHRHGIISEALLADDPQFRSDMLSRVTADCGNDVYLLGSVESFQATLIDEVIALERPGEVLVYLHRSDRLGGFGKERWWLARTETGWRIYDYENLHAGIRLSRCLAYLLEDSIRGRKSPVPLLLRLKKTLEIGQADAAAAQVALAGLDSAQLARDAAPVAALAGYCRGLALMQTGDVAGALAACGAARTAWPDFVAVLYLQGECENRLARYVEAIDTAATIDRLVGRDPLAAELRATALVGLDRRAELPPEFSTILDFKPTDIDALRSLYEALPAERRGEAVARFQTLMAQGGAWLKPQVDELFHALARGMLAAADDRTLEQLLAARRAPAGLAPQGTLAADDDLTILYQVKLYQLRGDCQSVIDYLGGRLSAVGDGDMRELLRDNRWQAFAALKKAPIAYREAVAADQPTAFRVLAEALQAAGDSDGLAELILLHHEQFPDDVWIHFFAGIRGLMMTDYVRAEAHLALAVPKAPDSITGAVFRRYWLMAAYHADHGMQAFGTCQDKRQAFAQLKQYYLAGAQDELLEMLCERYRPVAGDDPELFLADADILFLTGQYQPAIDLLDGRRKLILAGDPQQAWEFYDCLVRCLIRQQQYGFAEKELAAVADGKQAAFLRAMVAARQGQVVATAAALRDCQREGFTPELIYSDVDLGPALRGAAFADLRQEFPPPVEKPQTND